MSQQPAPVTFFSNFHRTKLAAEDAQKNNSRIWNFNEDFYIVAALALAGDSDAAIAAMENNFENGLYSTNFDG